MSKFFYALALVLSVPLASCALLPPPSTIHQQVDEKSIKALYVLEAAFKGVSASLEAAVDSGVLKGENAAKASQLYGQLKSALDKARTTKQTTDILFAQDVLASLWSVLLPG